MQPTYTAAVVGAGAGGKLSLNALERSSRFRLVAMCDQRAEVRNEISQHYPGIPTFASHHDMLAQTRADVVCVSTYPATHCDIALDALAHPLKGILVEKPLADTASAGRKILEAIQAKGIPVAVPHGLLVANHSTEILRRVHDGEIGDLRLVEIECDKWDIINAGIHWLNYFVVLTDNAPIDYVMGMSDTSTRTYRDGMQVETLAVTYVQAQNGVRCVMQTGDYVRTLSRDGGSPGCLFRIVGTVGVIEFYGWANEYVLTNAAHPVGEHFVVPSHSQTNHQLHLEGLATQMDVGVPDYTVAESSQTALALCEGSYLSHAFRCKVTLPLADFAPSPPNDWQPGKPYSGVGGGRDGRTLPREER